jgi:hypothetical protein
MDVGLPCLYFVERQFRTFLDNTELQGISKKLSVPNEVALMKYIIFADVNALKRSNKISHESIRYCRYRQKQRNRQRQ